MRVIQKKKELNILGLTVLIRISVSKNKKYTNLLIPRSYLTKFTIYALLLVSFFTIQYLFSQIFATPVYSTRELSFGREIYNSPTTPDIPELKNVTKQKPIISHGTRSKKQIALTFDADMTSQMKYDLETGFTKSYYDQDLINILRQTQTKATLFLSGMWIESYPEVAKNLAQDPLFELGNHTYSHMTFHGDCYGLTMAEESQKKDELIKTQELLKELTGSENQLFRFPGGCYSESDLKLVEDTGQIAIHWDSAAQDGFNTDSSNIVENVVESAQNGSIVVMHMNGYPNEPATANAIPIIIANLRERGFEFVTVSELLNIKSAKPIAVKKYLTDNFLSSNN